MPGAVISRGLPKRWMTVQKHGLGPLVNQLMELSNTFDKGIKVGVFGSEVDQDMKMASLSLEHRHKGAGPPHWSNEGGEYIKWAYASRTANTFEKKIAPDLATRLISKGISGDEFWHIMGQRAVVAMKAAMAGIQTPSNAPSTIRQKGFDNPLIETGEMKGAVKYQIKELEALEEETGTVAEEAPMMF